ncbi:hypothetical protein Q604_UNBC16455G0002, partial [human gut metagenome]
MEKHVLSVLVKNSSGGSLIAALF